MSLSAFRLQSSLEANINAQMYQKSILDDELSKNNELITDVSSLACILDMNTEKRCATYMYIYFCSKHHNKERCSSFRLRVLSALCP
jgi:hypothetical protein